jgi:type IV pilin PilA/uncharacterized protein DUF4190
MTPNPQYPGQPAGAPQGTSGVAIAALILGILGICLVIPFGLVSIILGIVALGQISKQPGLGGKGMAIFGIVAPLASLPIIGIMAAIAIPNFIKFQARSKQAECKANLAALYIAQKSHFAEKDTYSPNIEEIGFSPERGNRYAYFLFDVGEVLERSAASDGDASGAVGVGVDTFRYPQMRPVAAGDLPALAGDVKPGIHGQCPEKCSFVAACAGNIDNDEALDVWSISSEARTGPRGETIAAGTPFNDVSDIMN